VALSLPHNFFQFKNNSPPPRYVWRSLRYFNFYRVILAGLFVVPIMLNHRLPIIGSHNLPLFTMVAYSYLLIGIFSSFAIHWKKPSFKALVYGLAILDICVLITLMHASGGTQSGLGVLIIISVTGTSLLIASKTAGLIAAVAATSILADQVYSHLEGVIEPNYTNAGILGATLFATAMLFNILSKRLRDTEALANQRGIDLANMAQLTEHVVDRLQSGIIVVDAEDRIHLMNESAARMLGLPIEHTDNKKQLLSISADLQAQLTLWKNNEFNDSRMFRVAATSMELIPNFTRLGNDRYSGTLIFLEDTIRTAKQAQQMKLASLGRLTASIAHEIRNPLGAISHAEQLLAESESLATADRRLTEIIHKHAARVNAIIENVLQLSRRGSASPELMNLNHWLEHFAEEFVLSLGIGREELNINVHPETLMVNFDNTQLHQIVWNLCHNGIRHSQNCETNPKVKLVGGLNNVTQRPFLDVIDHGPGIDPDHIQHIFEPFFTTESNGSGLGLYISKELCEANNAQISYIPNTFGGGCFRIEFAKTEQKADQPPQSNTALAS
jgi:two-component system sensor histidine kinase PilS (NtrC family)